MVVGEDRALKWWSLLAGADGGANIETQSEPGSLYVKWVCSLALTGTQKISGGKEDSSDGVSKHMRSLHLPACSSALQTADSSSPATAWTKCLWIIHYMYVTFNKAELLFSVLQGLSCCVWEEGCACVNFTPVSAITGVHYWRVLAADTLSTAGTKPDQHLNLRVPLTGWEVSGWPEVLAWEGQQANHGPESVRRQRNDSDPERTMML